MVNLLITVVGLLSCVSPTLDEASRSRLQCHSIFILVSCQRGHGDGALEGTEEWSRGGSYFYNMTHLLSLLKQFTLVSMRWTIYRVLNKNKKFHGVSLECLFTVIHP